MRKRFLLFAELPAVLYFLHVAIVISTVIATALFIIIGVLMIWALDQIRRLYVARAALLKREQDAVGIIWS